MIDIQQYYCNSFQEQLDTAIGTEPPRYFGDGWRKRKCPELMQVPHQDRAAFIACLYYSVLFDQASCHHAHAQYKKIEGFRHYPKFSTPGKGHRKPREILRYPIVWDIVSVEELSRLAAPAAWLFVAEMTSTLAKLTPSVSPSDFFYLLTNFPEVNYWSPRIVREYPAASKVEQVYLSEMLAALR